MARRPRLHEFRLIEQLRRAFGRTGPSVVCGIGDDAAIIAPPKGRQLVLTTDLLIEGVHFDLRTSSFEDVGYKAAVANLSDIAAMGARPEQALVSIALPPSCAAPQVLRLYRGIMDACKPYRVALIGGDTSASPRGLFLGLTVTGSVPTGTALRRDRARAGDLLYVTGTLGDALAGLRLLSRGRSAAPSLKTSDRRFLVGRHHRPVAQIRLGQALSARRLASAAIDLSDGLSGDLRHLCEQSNTGAEIDAAALPFSPALRAYARSSSVDPLALALQGGEDYELLFSVPPAKQQLLKVAARHSGQRVTCIGTIRPSAFGLRLRETTGRLCRLPVTSYVHFRKAPSR